MDYAVVRGVKRLCEVHHLRSVRRRFAQGTKARLTRDTEEKDRERVTNKQERNRVLRSTKFYGFCI